MNVKGCYSIKCKYKVAPPFEWKDFKVRDVIDFIFGYSMLLYTDILILIDMDIYIHRILHN